MSAQSNAQRFMHTMIRVGDLERSVQFYRDHFGMEVVKRVDVPEGQYTNVFIGYGEEKSDPMIEPTYNYGKDSYELGTGFGHLAIGVRNIYAVCGRMRVAGARLLRRPRPATCGAVALALIADPDGQRVQPF